MSSLCAPGSCWRRPVKLNNSAGVGSPNYTYLSTYVRLKSARCFTLPLSPKRLYMSGGQAHECECGPQACNSLGEGINHGGVTVQPKEGTSLQSALQFDRLPWTSFTTKLTHQAVDAFWLVGKWIVVPTLILMGLRDAILAVLSSHELWIPTGLLVGTLFTGILKETLAALGIEFQHNVLPWHLVDLGFFFVIMRIGASKILPFWLRMFLYHFVIGGLWQTIRFCIDWKKKSEHFSLEDIKDTPL